jgi:hypothetical protein
LLVLTKVGSCSDWANTSQDYHPAMRSTHLMAYSSPFEAPLSGTTAPLGECKASESIG